MNVYTWLFLRDMTKWHPEKEILEWSEVEVTQQFSILKRRNYDGATDWSRYMESEKRELIPLKFDFWPYMYNEQEVTSM